MELDFRPVSGFEEFNSIKSDLLALFLRNFQRPYPLQFWDHFFQEIPCGPTRGVAVWNKDKLAGLSVLLSQELIDRRTNKLVPYGLNVSAMIDADSRQGGQTYFHLMRRLTALARQSGYRFLLAYPNSDRNVFLSLTRIGNFKLLDTARFVRCQGKLGPYKRFVDEESKKLFFSDRVWDWRLRRFPYEIHEGRITKFHQNERNILDWLAIKEDQAFTGIFPFWNSAGECPFEPVDDLIIRLCYLPLDQNFDIQKIKKSVMYSDVY